MGLNVEQKISLGEKTIVIYLKEVIDMEDLVMVRFQTTYKTRHQIGTIRATLYQKSKDLQFLVSKMNYLIHTFEP